MRLYRCDRCRKEFEFRGPLIGLSAPSPDYHLCPQCADALRSWLRGGAA